MIQPILAMEVDLVTLAALATTCITALGGLGTMLWKGVSAVWTYAKGKFDLKVDPILDEHLEMVKTLNTEMPKVSQTLAALKETQIQQCKQLNENTDLLKELLTKSGEHSPEGKPV